MERRSEEGLAPEHKKGRKEDKRVMGGKRRGREGRQGRASIIPENKS